jgi:hypothetical protein
MILQVCRQIYRSIINFIEHKRHYCTDIYDYQLHYLSNFVNNFYCNAKSNENQKKDDVKENKSNNNNNNKTTTKKMQQTFSSQPPTTIKTTANLSDENSMNSSDSNKDVWKFKL